MDDINIEEEGPPLSNEELGEIFAALDKQEEQYELLAYATVPKLPCPECGGMGSVPGGSLGDFCPRCQGQRFLDQPGEELPFEMPNFQGMRVALSAYAKALDDHLLPEGHPAKKHLALPPASSVPTKAQMEELAAQFKELKARLKAVPLPQLPEPRKREDAGILGPGDDDSDELSDEQLDELENEE